MKLQISPSAKNQDMTSTIQVLGSEIGYIYLLLNFWEGILETKIKYLLANYWEAMQRSGVNTQAFE